jgi:hypothetical protein
MNLVLSLLRSKDKSTEKISEKIKCTRRTCRTVVMASRAVRVSGLLVEACGSSTETGSGTLFSICQPVWRWASYWAARDMWLKVSMLVFRNNYCKLIMSKADCRTLMGCGHCVCVHAVIMSCACRLHSFICRCGLPIKGPGHRRSFPWWYENLNLMFMGHWRADLVGEKLRFLWGSY